MSAAAQHAAAAALLPLPSPALQAALDAAEGVTLRIEIEDAQTGALCELHTARPVRTTLGTAVRYGVRLVCGTPGACAAGPAAARGLVPPRGRILVHVLKLERLVTSVEIAYALPRPAPPPATTHAAAAARARGRDTRQRTFCALPTSVWALAHVPQPGADAIAARLAGAWDVFAAAAFVCAVECVCGHAGADAGTGTGTGAGTAHNTGGEELMEDDADADADADAADMQPGAARATDDMLAYRYIASTADAAYCLQSLDVHIEADFFLFYLRTTAQLAAGGAAC